MTLSSEKNTTISVDNFPHIIKKCRSKETSADPDKWSDSNPSYRQCLITALLANEILGLDVYAEKVRLDNGFNDYHYFNKNKKNIPVRFCEEQFLYEKIVSKTCERPLYKDRIDIMLARSPGIKQRYEILKKKFEEEIALLFR